MMKMNGKMKVWMLWLLLMLCICLVPASGMRAEKASGKPEEEALRSRVSAFWTAWQKGNTAKLLLLVRKEDRPAFSEMKRFEVLGFSISNVELSKNSKTALVETRMKRQFPMRSQAWEWSLENEWVMVQGNWYLAYKTGPDGTAGLFGEVKARRSIVPAETPAPQDLIFRETVHDFGTVRVGTPLHWEFEFENRGTRPIRITRVLTSCPPEGAASDGKCAGCSPNAAPAPEGKCLTAHSNGTVFMPNTPGKIIADWPDVSTSQKVDHTIEVDFDDGGVVILHFVAQITT
jgi:hypothetical protein